MAKKKRTQLVNQYLENISRRALEKYQVVIRNFVRGRRGIYALYRKDRLYYVGLASNLRSRLRTHLRDRHTISWDRFSVYLAISDSHLKELESLILRIVEPPGNKVSGKFAYAEDLRRRFKRELDASHDEDVVDMLGGGKRGYHKVRAETKSKARKSDGKSPALAAYKNRPEKLVRKYKGSRYTATVRANGTIRCRGKTFNSPSLAAMSITKRTTNGWSFWRYERAPGEWVKLDVLRK